MISPDDPARLKTGRRLVGVAFLVLLGLLLWVSVAIYQKQFTGVTTVTLRTSSLGNEMHPHAEVKLRGVPIGEVREIEADGRGAKLTLAFQPDKVHLVPANVTAQMLPTTLFGQRYVALIPPPAPSSQPLAAGMTITEDRTSSAVELQRILANSLPLLTAVRPEKLSATLTAVAQALQGRGTRLGETLVRLDAYLAKTNPTLPQLNQDIHELVSLTQTYSQAVPDLLQALTDFSVTSRTIVDQRADLGDLYSTVTRSAQDITAFLRANEDNIIRLSVHSRPSLEVLARHAPAFPCTLQMLAGFVPSIDRALGKGTRQHGLHVTAKVVPSLGKYVPGRDRPVYNAPDLGPRCYTVPYRGVRDGHAPAPTASTMMAAGLGMPNSPGENRLVNELIAVTGGGDPGALPDWSSVLVGGLYRGSEVTLK